MCDYTVKEYEMLRFDNRNITNEVKIPSFFKKHALEIKDLPKEIQKVINDNFYELLG